MINKLTYILQFCDSYFPNGTFSQSFGMETYVQNGKIKNKEELFTYIKTYLCYSFATSDALSLLLTYNYAKSNDYKSILRIDKKLNALKIASESRKGSRKMGKQTIKIATNMYHNVLLDKIMASVNNSDMFGHHAVILGSIAGSLSLDEKQFLIAYIYNTVSSLTTCGVKLIPLGQIAGQKIIFDLGNTISSVAQKIANLKEDDLGTCTPALEISMMKHEILYSRLYMS